jgi:hypothetical protein
MVEEGDGCTEVFWLETNTHFHQVSFKAWFILKIIVADYHFK